jgi:amino acid permease
MGSIARNFTSMEKGSIRGSILTTICSSVGAGVLSMPRVMSYYGLAMGSALIIISCFFAYTSYLALLAAIKGSKRNSYPNVVSYYLGKVTFVV